MALCCAAKCTNTHISITVYRTDNWLISSYNLGPHKDNVQHICGFVHLYDYFLMLLVLVLHFSLPSLLRCRNCGSPGHRSWECTEQKNVVSNIICTRCGGGGHIASDCKTEMYVQCIHCIGLCACIVCFVHTLCVLYACNVCIRSVLIAGFLPLYAERAILL